jgi:hypothetical protein
MCVTKLMTLAKTIDWLLERLDSGLFPVEEVKDESGVLYNCGSM